MKVFTKDMQNLVDFPKEETENLMKFLHADKLTLHKIRKRDLDASGEIFGTVQTNVRNLEKLTHAFKVTKNIKYISEYAWNGTLTKKYKQELVGIVFRKWKNWMIPLYPEFTFEQTKKSSAFLSKKRGESKKIFEQWKLLDKECTFLYSGKSRGLYESEDSYTIRQELGRTLKRGDMVVVVDHKLRIVDTPSKSKNSIDLFTFDFQNYQFKVIYEPFSPFFGNINSGFIVNNTLYQVHGTVFPIEEEVSESSVFVSGMLQVLASGTHGWLKISSKSLEQIGKDFLVEGTPEYDALNAWRSEQDG